MSEVVGLMGVVAGPCFMVYGDSHKMPSIFALGWGCLSMGGALAVCGLMFPGFL